MEKNYRYTTFGVQERFKPTHKAEDLFTIIELFGELVKEKKYMTGLDVKILGTIYHIYEYKLYYIFDGLYIVYLKDIEDLSYIFAFIDNNNVDKTFFAENFNIKEAKSNFMDFSEMKLIFEEENDCVDKDLGLCAYPLDLVYTFLSIYLIYMFHILSFNLVELTEAYENKRLDSFPMIDLSVAKNIKNYKFSLDTLSSLASNTSIKDIHTQMIKTIDSIVPMKQDSMSVLCRDSKYLLKCPFKGIYGFVNKAPINEDSELEVRFLKEEDAEVLQDKWSASFYPRRLWNIASKKTYSEDIDSFVAQLLISRGIMNIEYSLACLGKEPSGRPIGKFKAWKIKRRLKKLDI